VKRRNFMQLCGFTAIGATAKALGGCCSYEETALRNDLNEDQIRFLRANCACKPGSQDFWGWLIKEIPRPDGDIWTIQLYDTSEMPGKDALYLTAQSTKGMCMARYGYKNEELSWYYQTEDQLRQRTRTTY